MQAAAIWLHRSGMKLPSVSAGKPGWVAGDSMSGVRDNCMSLISTSGIGQAHSAAPVRLDTTMRGCRPHQSRALALLLR